MLQFLHSNQVEHLSKGLQFLHMIWMCTVLKEEIGGGRSHFYRLAVLFWNLSELILAPSQLYVCSTFGGWHVIMHCNIPYYNYWLVATNLAIRAKMIFFFNHHLQLQPSTRCKNYANQYWNKKSSAACKKISSSTLRGVGFNLMHSNSMQFIILFGRLTDWKCQ